MQIPTFCLLILLFSSFFTSVTAAEQSPPEGLDPAYVKGRAPKSHEPVIIVGGGLAGLSAALEALEEGATKVVIVDKEKALGGNSAKASSGINGCGTKAQKTLGIVDSVERFYLDTMSAGDRENDPSLVDILVHESAAAVQFLIDNGVDLSDVNLCGGHSVPRTHWIPSPKEGKPLPVGVAIIRALNNRLDEWLAKSPEKLEIRLNAAVVGLVTWNDYITGVRYRNTENQIEEISGKAVVLTTGGFSADSRTSSAPGDPSSLMAEFAPDLLHLPTTNGAFATGDGVKMARAMGAQLIGMDQVQVHPTAFIDPKDPAAKTKFLAAEALRGKGAILVNHQCKRFANELGRRDTVTALINKHCALDADAGNLPVTFMVMDNASADAFGRPAFNFYAKIKGFFKEVANAEELAREIGCKDEKAMRATLEEYNGFVEQSAKSDQQGFKDPFGKVVFPAKFDPSSPLYLARITPAIHYTMGGLKIDRQAFVFSEFMGRPFQGLLAAGEVTGGVHGRNRLAGNSLLECVVFGRIAGRSAAQVNYHGTNRPSTKNVEIDEAPNHLEL